MSCCTAPRPGEDNTAQNVAGFFWSRLYEWDLRYVVGYRGDRINGLLGGLQRLGEDKIRCMNELGAQLLHSSDPT